MIKKYLNNNKKILIIPFAFIAIYTLCFYIYTSFDCAMALSIDGLSNRLSQIESSLLYEVKAKQNNTNYFKDMLVLFNVNLIDGNNNNIKYNTTIIINGSKIVDIINKNDTNRGTKTNIYQSYPNSTLIDSFRQIYNPWLI